MKIAAVSMIKDECDIIETFIRVNARWADHFFVLDNGSSDHTPHILRRLSEEGFPITMERDPSIHYRQSEMTTRLARKALEAGSFDFVFPIDGDEFIADPAAFKLALQQLSGNSVGALDWSTLVPHDGHVMSRPSPLVDGFSRRRTEVRRICKVVIPADFVRTGVIGMGNHGILDASGKPAAQTDLGLPLFHVPVRSKEQIIAKTLIGSHKMSIKLGRKKDEVFHWDLIAEFIRANGFILSDEQLREIALGYGWSKGDPKVRETMPVSIGEEGDLLRYAELSRINLAHLLDGFLAQLCDEVRLTRTSVGMSKRLLVRWLRS